MQYQEFYACACTQSVPVYADEGWLHLPVSFVQVHFYPNEYPEEGECSADYFGDACANDGDVNWVARILEWALCGFYSALGVIQ